MTIRAHFNGTVIVPDEPVDLPADMVRRLAALSEFVTHGVVGADIPDEMLCRKHIYGDSGR